MQITYTGPHDVTEVYTGHDVRDDLDDLGAWVTVERGGTIDVPDWVALGAPALPGVALVDGAEVEFAFGEDPAGEIVIPASPPLGGLLEQTDNWRRADASKASKASKAAAPTTTPDEGTDHPEGDDQ